MFENIINIFKKSKKNKGLNSSSKETAKERLHLVLMQDRANVSADFLDLMRKEIIEVIKKYIDIDEKSMDVRLTNETNEDGTQGAPALYANIPIINIKEETRKIKKDTTVNKTTDEENKEKEEEPIKYKKDHTKTEDNKQTKNENNEEKKIEPEKEKNIKDQIENKDDTKDTTKTQNLEEEKEKKDEE